MLKYRERERGRDRSIEEERDLLSDIAKNCTRHVLPDDVPVKTNTHTHIDEIES